MKFFKPITVTDSILTSSTVAEADYAEWEAATSYTLGQKVIRLTTHRIYENLIAGVNATLPENATGGATPRWLDVGPTNRWAMFDNEVGSYTTDASPIIVTLTPGSIDGVSLIEISGASSAAVYYKDMPGGTTLYSAVVTDLDTAEFSEIFDFFTMAYEPVTVLNFSGIPSGYMSGELTIQITGVGSVSLGAAKFGLKRDLGGTQYGATLGIIDYSRKETNDFGRVQITPRRNVKTLTAKMLFENGKMPSIYKALSNATTTPCIWIGADEDGQLEGITTIYGFYKDFTVDIAYPTSSYCSLTIEGII